MKDGHPPWGSDQQGAPQRGLQPALSIPSAKNRHRVDTKHGKFQPKRKESEKDVSTSGGGQAGIAVGAPSPFQRFLPTTASANKEQSPCACHVQPRRDRRICFCC